MAFISSFTINTTKQNPFPYNVPAVRFAKSINLETPITFLVGDNGTGKSTLLETLALKLNLPLIGGYIGSKKGFEAANTLKKYLTIRWKVETSRGFFFRAEDFSQFIDGVEQNDLKLENYYGSMRGEVPDHIIDQMKQSQNYSLNKMTEKYGGDMQAYSHGEAYLKIMEERINGKGIFLLDEPEAALSPSRQIALIYLIKEHINRYPSQFIIATHSPILMAIPGASLYEITDSGVDKVPFEETEHYYITKTFLDDPNAFLRHLHDEP